jgi:hypothetical protein
MVAQEKDPVVTQEPTGGTLGEGLVAILEVYQDEEEVATPEEGKTDYGINNLQGSLTLSDSK